MVTKKSIAAAKKPVTPAAAAEAAPRKPAAARKTAAAPKPAAVGKAEAAPKPLAAPRKPRPTAPAPKLDERVRLAAYLRFEARGATAGDALADWLAAEAEIALEDAAATVPTEPRARTKP